MSPVPIACTLSPSGAQDQLAEWREVLAACVTAVEVEGSRAMFDLDPARLDADALLSLVRREQACCAFLSFRLDVTAAGTQLVLDAPSEAAEVVGRFAALARA